MIESKLRITAMSNKEIIKYVPRNPRSKGLDHKVATFDFSELYEQLLMSPASDSFIISKWKKYSNDPIELLKLSAQTTKIEELNFPLSIDELNILRKFRNNCMHFRVTTLNDYIDTVKMINTYLLDKNKRTFANGLTQALKPLQKTFKTLDENNKALRTLLGL